MKRRIFFILGGVALVGGGFAVGDAGALTYQSSVSPQFTIQNAITIEVPSGGITISDLAPGTKATSSAATVTVYTNNPGGYKLNASVGESTSPHNNRNLTNKSDSNATFSSIDFGSSLDELTTAGTWGYTFSVDNGENWAKLSGLPYYDDEDESHTAELMKNSKATAAEGDALQLKISAYANTTQAAGTYDNVINFVATGQKAATDLYMQDVSTWASTIPNSGDTVQAVDNRDTKKYWVTRLADGNIWMTQNLDFDIDSTKTYTSADTDIKADWTPSTATTTGTTWSTASTYYNLPQSYDPGDRCWNGTVTTATSGTLSNSTVACPDGSDVDMHTRVGNYYDWTAAVAMNNSSSYTAQNKDVDQSICPAGWMLPKSGTTLTGSGSFIYLKNQQNLTSGTGGNIHQSPAYFVYGGYWNGSSGNVGYDGSYWSSVVYNSYNGYYLYFNASGTLNPQDNNNRNNGYSVRCVAR